MTWPKVQLGDACDVRDGTHDSPKYVEAGFPLLTSKNFSGGSINFKEAKLISKSDFEKINKRSKVDEGDIIMPMIGTIGGPVIVNFEPNFAIKNVALIKPGREALDTKFIREVLNSQLFNAHVQSVRRGGTQKFMSLGDIRSFQIPLPPLDEQRHIAAILDKAKLLQETAIKRRKSLEEFKVACFRYLFGTFSNADRNWPTQSIKSCSESIQTGPFGSLLHKADYIEEGIPILNPKHILKGIITPDNSESISRAKSEELSGYRLKKGDILLARRGEMGRCAAISENENGWLCGTGSMFIRPLPEKLESSYLCALLSSEHMRRKLEKIAIGTTLLNLNSEIIGQLLIPVPPINLQAKYSALIKKAGSIDNIALKMNGRISAALASLNADLFGNKEA